MGVMTFSVPQKGPHIAAVASRAYVAGLEGIPWETRCEFARGQLTVERDVEESGFLHVPWNLDGFGEVILSTSTLMERFEPYLLQLELARGSVNRIRNQLAQWESLGLVASDSLKKQIRDVQAIFASAATNQASRNECVAACERCLVEAHKASIMLAETYTEQSLAQRHEGGRKIPALLGSRLEGAPPEGPLENLFATGFNAALVPMLWREVEATQGEGRWETSDRQINWCRDQGLRIVGGPLMQLDQRSIPDWVYLWEDDFDEFRDFQRRHVKAAVERYRGRVQVWCCAGRVNVESAVVFEEEQMLRLTVDAIETIRVADPRTPIVVAFDQPWSEHMTHRDRDLPPMYFADTLVRADLGVAGFALEINWGWWPKGTPQRDLLELNRLVDRWSLLGLPLMVLLTAPSSAAADDAAKLKSPVTPGLAPVVSPQWQREVASHVVPMLLSKNNVQAVIWNQWTDTQTRDFGSAGLIDASGKPKPALSWLSDWKKEHLV